MARARGDDQVVVFHRPVRGDHAPARDINALRLGQYHLGVFLVAQDVAQRFRDVRRRERRGRDLIEQRLEEVMILAIEERDAHADLAERLRGLQSAEAAADDDDAGQIAMMDVHECSCQCMV